MCFLNALFWFCPRIPTLTVQILTFLNPSPPPLNVQWTLSWELVNMSTAPNSDPLARKTAQHHCSAHDYGTIASIYELEAAHKRKPQETNNVRKLIILILFIIHFLNYFGLPVVPERATFFGYTTQNWHRFTCTRSSICVLAASNVQIQIGCRVKYVESLSELFESCFYLSVRGP